MTLLTLAIAALAGPTAAAAVPPLLRCQGSGRDMYLEFKDRHVTVKQASGEEPDQSARFAPGPPGTRSIRFDIGRAQYTVQRSSKGWSWWAHFPDAHVSGPLWSGNCYEGPGAGW